MNKNFSEYLYREDIEMAAPNALYNNDSLIKDLGRAVYLNDNITLLFCVLATTLPSQPCYSKNDENINNIELKQQMKPLSEEIIKPDQLTDYDRIKMFVSTLYTIPKDVPNKGFVVPSREISNNAVGFLDALEKRHIQCPKRDDVMPSPFGTVIVDFETKRGLVSVEVGRTKIGYFTDFEDGINEESDGIITNFKDVPIQLLSLLK